nr:hypothetical protein [Tanacetum cinerariifolium]
GCYKCQLDEQWFDLTKQTLREALQITPVNRNQAFAAPPSIDGLINFVNQLGYPKLVMNLSTVVTNDLFQSWRALLTIINLCLTGKTYGFERPRAPVLQILWGIVTRNNIDYAERIWEEFTQTIHTFIEDKRNLSRHTSGKKRATLIVIPSIRFTKLIIHHLQKKHRFPPRPDSPLHLSNKEPVLGYLKFSAKGTKREIFGMPIPGFLAGETRSTQDLPAPKLAKPARKPQSTAQKAPLKPSISSSVTSTQPAPTSSRGSPKSVGESEVEKVPVEETQVADEDVDFQKAVEESMKDAYALPKGPLPPVVIREPESGKYQPLPEVPRKGKAKVSEEQVSHNLLSLQKHKKTSPADQYIFQRRVSEPTASSFHDVSPYEVLGQSDSEDESEKIVLRTGSDTGAQAEGQAGSNPEETSEGQAGSNPDETSEGQAGSNPDETSEGQAGPDPGNAELQLLWFTLDQTVNTWILMLLMFHLNLPRSNYTKGLLQRSIRMYKRISSLPLKNRLTNLQMQTKSAETEVESMVNVPIQQALSSISLMTSPIIDLTSRPESPKEHQQLKATTTDTTTTTTTTLPPPQAPQQSTTEVMMVKRIGELEHTLADLIQVNKTMEERLDKHGAHTMTDVMALPVRSNDQSLPRIRWVQTGYLNFSAKGTKREVFGIPIPGGLITADL